MNEIKNEKYWIRQQDNLEFMKELDSESIDLLYGDILYSTKKKFKDYDDNLWKTPQEAMLFYKPRLIEMKRILKDTGSIYLQCDYRLVHYLKVLMDEIFGIENFRNELIWKYGLGRSSDKQFGKRHDNILWYSNTRKYVYNKQLEDATSQRMLGEKKNMSDVWVDIPNINNMAKERIGYGTQKPKALLERIIKASSNEGDTVLDCFAGSHTTGEVAIELGRYYIGCDIGDRAFEIAKQRLTKPKGD